MYYPTVSTVTLGSHGVLDFYRPIKCENNQPGNCTSTRASNADVSPTLQVFICVIKIYDITNYKYIHGPNLEILATSKI